MTLPKSFRRSGRSSSGKAFLLLLVPFVVLFAVFIVIPIAIAIILSFTNFDTVQAPKWNNLGNYVYLLTQDTEFMKYILPNSIKFALIV
ncbi:MAG: hypothetical protein ACYC5K_13960, partial [Saccharofermentanales bacterium]